jgi:ribonuclease P protein component
VAGTDRPQRAALRRADFVRITRRGRRTVTPLFLVFILARSDGQEARLGITVTRKVGNAVRRNRIKRLVREWFRHCRGELGPCDIVVVAKRDIPEGLRLPEVGADLDRAVEPAGSPGV